MIYLQALKLADAKLQTFGQTYKRIDEWMEGRKEGRKGG